MLRTKWAIGGALLGAWIAACSSKPSDVDHGKAGRAGQPSAGSGAQSGAGGMTSGGRGGSMMSSAGEDNAGDTGHVTETGGTGATGGTRASGGSGGTQGTDGDAGAGGEPVTGNGGEGNQSLGGLGGVGGGSGMTAKGGARSRGGARGRGGASAVGGTSGAGAVSGGAGANNVAGMSGSGGTSGAAGAGGTSGGLGGNPGSGGTFASGGASGGKAGAGGAGGSPTCTEINLPTMMSYRDTSDVPNYAGYSYLINAIGAADPDYAEIDFYGPGEGYDGDKKGTFTLGTGPDANFQTCGRCVLAEKDSGGTDDVLFFASSGTMNVGSTSDQLNGFPVVTFTDVTLVEVTIDSTSHISTPVAGGRCLHLASGSMAFPSNWTCDPDYYAAGDGCDCGCGARDGDCASSTATACDYCHCPGDTLTCATNHAKPTNNAVCQ